jgi:hypothetical protein
MSGVDPFTSFRRRVNGVSSLTPKAYERIAEQLPETPFVDRLEA